MSISDEIASRIKVKVKKPLKNPDNRTDLCGEPFKMGDDGREFAIIPAHCAAHHAKLFPTYEFSEEFEVSEKKSPGRPPKEA